MRGGFRKGPFGPGKFRDFRPPDRLALPGFLAHLPGGWVLQEKGIVGAELAAPEILSDRARRIHRRACARPVFSPRSRSRVRRG